MSAAKQLVSSALGPCRQKYWSELTSDERIERLRGELKKALSACERLAKTVAKQREQLELHRHAAPDGSPMVPMVNPSQWGESEAPARSRDTSGDDVFM